MLHSQRLLAPAQCAARAFPPRFSLTLLSVPRRSYLDARRIASAQPAVQVDRLAGFVRDEQIESFTVRVKNEDGELGTPQNLHHIIRNIDRKTHTVVQLGKADGDTPAVVQIFEKTDLLKQVREKENRARQQQLATKDKKPKQIELNWAISGNDLDLKLKQMETFLEKGKKVEVLLASKRRQRRATLDEASNVLKLVRQKISDIGAKEIKAMDGEILKQATMTVKK